ncbi:metallophosphoesterase family protein [Streptococcus hyovaginalis]
MAQYDFNSLKKLIGDEAENNDNYYRDPEHLGTIQEDIANGKKDSISITLARWLRQKKYGIDVRESLARFVEWISVQVNKVFDRVTTTERLQQEVIVRQDRLENRYEIQLANNTDVSEVIDARIGVNGEENLTLGQRLNNELGQLLTSANLDKFEELKKYVLDEETNYGGKIPDYLEPDFEDIKNIKNTVIDGRAVIGFSTDAHYQADGYAFNELQHATWFAYASKFIPMDALVFGGDNLNNYYDLKRGREEANRFINVVEGHKNPDTPVFYLNGNHDNGRGVNGKLKSGQSFTDDYLKEIFGAKDSKYGEIRNGNSLYFYKDLPDKKIRIIGLNNFDLPETTSSDGTYKFQTISVGGYQNEQLNWLAKEALNLPDNSWQTVIFQHAPFTGTFQPLIDGSPGTTLYNEDVCQKILAAFQNGGKYIESNLSAPLPFDVSVDFTDKGEGTIIAIVNGHSHRDGQMFWKGLNLIQTDCSLSSSYDSDRGRIRETASETVFDVFLIDTLNRKITIKRFGAGENREFDY